MSSCYTMWEQKSRFTTWPPLIPDGAGVPQYSAEGESSGPHWASADSTRVKERAISLLLPYWHHRGTGIKVVASLLGFL